MKTIVIAIIATLITTGCMVYVPTQQPIIIELRSDEAYYAGFFRACEMLLNAQLDGTYIEIAESAEMRAIDQCAELTQAMIDAEAASYYSNNWPGIMNLSPEHSPWTRQTESGGNW